MGLKRETKLFSKLQERFLIADKKGFYGGHL